MPNFSYPLHIWDCAICDTVHHHVEIHIEVLDHVYECIDEHHEHGIERPAAECKQGMDQKERTPCLDESSGVRSSVVEY